MSLVIYLWQCNKTKIVGKLLTVLIKRINLNVLIRKIIPKAYIAVFKKSILLTINVVASIINDQFQRLKTIDILNIRELMREFSQQIDKKWIKKYWQSVNWSQKQVNLMEDDRLSVIYYKIYYSRTAKYYRNIIKRIWKFEAIMNFSAFAFSRNHLQDFSTISELPANFHSILWMCYLIFDYDLIDSIICLCFMLNKPIRNFYQKMRPLHLNK